MGPRIEGLSEVHIATYFGGSRRLEEVRSHPELACRPYRSAWEYGWVRRYIDIGALSCVFGECTVYAEAQM